MELCKQCSHPFATAHNQNDISPIPKEFSSPRNEIDNNWKLIIMHNGIQEQCLNDGRTKQKRKKINCQPKQISYHSNSFREWYATMFTDHQWTARKKTNTFPLAVDCCFIRPFPIHCWRSSLINVIMDEKSGKNVGVSIRIFRVIKRTPSENWNMDTWDGRHFDGCVCQECVANVRQ